jgi:hypothetical protein
MELDVTAMVERADDMIELCGSRMEHGQNAGQITWNNSVNYGRDQPLLKTDVERDAARRHFREYGAWSQAEIDAWSEEELQGIMCQDVAHAIRYDEYLAGVEGGQYSGNIYRGDDGRWYYDLGV